MVWALIPSWVKNAAAAIGAILVACAVAFLQGRRSGVTSVETKIAKETQKVDAKFQKIDAAPADFPGAIDSLRKRTNRG